MRRVRWIGLYGGDDATLAALTFATCLFLKKLACRHYVAVKYYTNVQRPELNQAISAFPGGDETTRKKRYYD